MTLNEKNSQNFTRNEINKTKLGTIIREGK